MPSHSQMTIEGIFLPTEALRTCIKKNGQIKIDEVRTWPGNIFGREACIESRKEPGEKEKRWWPNSRYLSMAACYGLPFACMPAVFLSIFFASPTYPLMTSFAFLSALDFLVKEVDRGCWVGFPGILLFYFSRLYVCATKDPWALSFDFLCSPT